MSSSNTVLIITGPTASGKTQLSELLHPIINGEIINADMGQFYKPLSIGTAKPNLNLAKYKHHLFDIIDAPQDLSVAEYRQFVYEKVKLISSSGKTPIIVGGSLFYIKSLFFPPLVLRDGQNPAPDIDLDRLFESELRDLLIKIDSVRAEQVHKNDSYRIRRALDIWQKTGQKPSIYKPIFNPIFNALIIFLSPPVEILNQRIRERTELMITSGWIDEAKSLIGTDWQKFIKFKGLIGYSEIFDHLSNMSLESSLPNLINDIQIKTMQYAKRQRTFWRSFVNQLGQECGKENYFIKILEHSYFDDDIIKSTIHEFNNIQKR